MADRAEPMPPRLQAPRLGLIARLRAAAMRHEPIRGYTLLSPTLVWMLVALAIPLAILVTLSFWTQNYLDFDRTFSLKFTKQLRNKVAAPVVATFRVGGAQILGLLNFFFSNHGMLVAGGVCGYGYTKGEVRTGVGAWTPSALDEARAVGKSIVRLVEQLERGKQ